MRLTRDPWTRRPCRPSERGITLVVTLVMLVALAFTAVALMRSVDTSTLLARNTSFQRDAVNRNELAMQRAIAQFARGARFEELRNTTASFADAALALVYRPAVLPTDAQGIPLALKTPGGLAALCGAARDDDCAIDSRQGMRTVAVIERLCVDPAQPAHAGHCTPSSTRVPDTCSRCAQVQSPFAPVFRVTARTRGPRGVEAFSQLTFSLPME